MDKSIYNREIILTLEEAALTLAISRMSLYRYRQYHRDFPPLPTFKAAVRGWAERYGLPRKRGPQPSYKRRLVVLKRGEEKRTFAEIARKLRISPQAAQQLWKRNHMRQPKRS